ncbi:MAG TPA: hypothetical protein PLT75_07820 [Spirochaetota bacterium]|nr:hypothetical protein [Spirochaetota bacterium]
MDEVTIISYPGTKNANLLSLARGRSKYMLPFGGRSRIVDFTIRNSMISGARKTILFSNIKDNLEDYVEHYGPFRGENFPAIKVVSKEYSDIHVCYDLILDSNTNYYIIYSGDDPALIDFREMLGLFRKSRKKAMLYKLKFGGHATLAHTVLITTQKTLLKVIDSAIEEERKAPNIFDMIINMMLNDGIDTGTFGVTCWPLHNIPDYYNFTMEVVKNRDIFSLIYGESEIKSWIQYERYANVGVNANIQNSFISDGCDINGTVINSIVYPGVTIGKKAYVKDSILLPYVRIGAGARIFRTIVDESFITPGEEEEYYNNIGENCIVGTENEGLKNNDYPRSIFSSISLIGNDCRIPGGARVGGACYIAPGLGMDYFFKTRVLYDGMSIVK